MYVLYQEPCNVTMYQLQQRNIPPVDRLAVMQNGRAAAAALLAACQGLRRDDSAFKVLLGQAIEIIRTDSGTGHIETLETTEHRQAIPRVAHFLKLV